jgi:hypothetical protein
MGSPRCLCFVCHVSMLLPYGLRDHLAVCVSPNFFPPFSMMFVLYQRKLGDHLFPELLIVVMHLNSAEARRNEDSVTCCSLARLPL